MLKTGATGIWELRVLASTLRIPNGVVVDAAIPLLHDQRKYVQSSFGKSCGVTASDNWLVCGNFAVGSPCECVKTPLSAYSAKYKPVTFLFGGLQKNRWAGLSLPFDLGPLGAKGCSLYISLDWVFPTIVNDGPWHHGAADVPNVQALLGKTFYLQAILFVPEVNPLGLVTSQGVAATIGPRPIIEASRVRIPLGGRSIYFDSLGERNVWFVPVFELGY
ncbi:MAG: hypothetical protein ACE5F1_06965 [Planctomycetota bacterium]